MKISTILYSCIIASACYATSAFAAEPLKITFTRTGTSANDVVVNVHGAEGVSASITSISHSLKAISNASIICPDVNGNTSPNIELSLSVSGLDNTTEFNGIGLHIHALNSNGGYQQNNDSKERRYTVLTSINGNEFVTFENFDIAAGVPNSNKLWEANAETGIQATSPLNITLNISANAETNKGCFFGLESITLGLSKSEEPNPDPGTTPSDSKYYTIKWKNNTTNYMTELPDGGIAIGSYSVFNKVFWEFIPTENENCYYIRNTSTGNYIGSCNLKPDSTSKVKMSAEPVEYYIQLSASSSGENRGCYWLSSTDCTNYDNESSGARCLNKDGASANVITWTTGVNNVGSYWTLAESPNLYEIKPFTSSETIGKCKAAYHIMNDSGLAYANDNTWVEFDVTSKNQQWYFVGTSNSDGGYQVVNLAENTPMNNGAKYKVSDTQGHAPYKFIDSNGTILSIAGVTDVTFVLARSEFAFNNQIYQMPCGTVGDVYIKKAHIGEDFYYPMGKYQSKKVVYSSATTPTNKYVILTRDKADVTISSEVSINLSLNKELGNYSANIYFDWNQDGFFETMQNLTANSKVIENTFIVPNNAKLGKTRARIRINNNGLNGADDEINGQVFDFLLNVVNTNEETFEPIVKSNAENRGEAIWEDGIAKATAKGNSTFLYWSEGHRILSVNPDFEIAASNLRRILTAHFTPNTEEFNGIDDIILSNVDTNSKVLFDGSTITVETNSNVKAIVLFAINGQKVAGTLDNHLNTLGICKGVYIVKAITENGLVSAKIII